MAVSFQCMTKSTTNKKIKKIKKNNETFLSYSNFEINKQKKNPKNKINLKWKVYLKCY